MINDQKYRKVNLLQKTTSGLLSGKNELSDSELHTLTNNIRKLHAPHVDIKEIENNNTSSVQSKISGCSVLLSLLSSFCVKSIRIPYIWP